MKNKKYKTLIAATVITGVLGSCMGCNTNTGEYSSSGRDSVESSVFSSFEEEKKWNTIGEGDQLIERPLIDDEEREEFLRDLNFSRGFGVSAFHANTSGGRTQSGRRGSVERGAVGLHEISDGRGV